MDPNRRRSPSKPQLVHKSARASALAMDMMDSASALPACPQRQHQQQSVDRNWLTITHSIARRSVMKSSRRMFFAPRTHRPRRRRVPVSARECGQIALAGIFGQRLVARPRSCQFHARCKVFDLKRPNRRAAFRNISELAWRGWPKGSCRRPRDTASTRSPLRRAARVVAGIGPC